MSKGGAMTIEVKQLDWLKPYAKNAKHHPDDQIERLASTIKRLGWDQPIVAETDGTIIKGHGRRLAAIKLGLTTVPVLVRSDLTKTEADAARIADNAVVGQSFDTRVMQEELRRLMAEDPTISDTDMGLSDQDRKLLLEQLDMPEINSLMTDTTREIEEQKTEEARRVTEVDGEQVKIAEAFGFKTVSRSDVRIIAQAMAQAEEDSGKTGSEALIFWLSRGV